MISFFAYMEAHGGVPRCRHTLDTNGRCRGCDQVFPCVHTDSERASQREIMRGLFGEWIAREDETNRPQRQRERHAIDRGTRRETTPSDLLPWVPKRSPM